MIQVTFSLLKTMWSTSGQHGVNVKQIHLLCIFVELIEFELKT